MTENTPNDQYLDAWINKDLGIPGDIQNYYESRFHRWLVNSVILRAYQDVVSYYCSNKKPTFEDFTSAKDYITSKYCKEHFDILNKMGAEIDYKTFLEKIRTEVAKI